MNGSRLILSRIRRNCTYTVQDLCQLFGVHKNTVREWFRHGLPKTDSERPYLIHGNDLREFLAARRQSRRKRCALDEFYCFRCRHPRRAMGNLADLGFRSAKTVEITGLCESCGTSLHKLQSVKALPKLLQTFDIPTHQQEHIRECLKPSLYCDFEKETKR